MIDWRTIEKHLVDIAKDNSIDVFDLHGNPAIDCEDTEGDLATYSLTDLAKELAERLK